MSGARTIEGVLENPLDTSESSERSIVRIGLETTELRVRNETQVGVPIKLLHEGEGHMVTIELRNGEIYRGHLDETEETMNCLLTDVVLTARDGHVTKMENVYIRGSQVKFMILPDLLKHSPVFDKVKQLKRDDDAKPTRSSGKKSANK